MKLKLNQSIGLCAIRIINIMQLFDVKYSSFSPTSWIKRQRSKPKPILPLSNDIGWLAHHHGVLWRMLPARLAGHYEMLAASPEKPRIGKQSGSFIHSVNLWIESVALTL